MMQAAELEPCGGDAGFTLLEVMVAFAIAALAAIVLFQSGFSGVLESGLAARTQEAVIRAQSHLASIGTLTPLAPMQASGDDGGGYHWQLDITPGQSNGLLRLYSVRVSESFGTRQVVLATQMLGPGT